LVQHIIALPAGEQVAAGPADVVRGDYEVDFQVGIGQDLLCHRVKGVTVGVRLVAYAVPVIAQDI
jgi:hypothetical protein